jgi:hypothetical protein
MEMQSIIYALTSRRDQLNEQAAQRKQGQPVDLVLGCRIDLLNTAILSLHHYDAPDDDIRKAVGI